jgi:hypothetical protein
MYLLHLSFRNLFLLYFTFFSLFRLISLVDLSKILILGNLFTQPRTRTILQIREKWLPQNHVQISSNAYALLFSLYMHLPTWRERFNLKCYGIKIYLPYILVQLKSKRTVELLLLIFILNLWPKFLRLISGLYCATAFNASLIHLGFQNCTADFQQKIFTPAQKHPPLIFTPGLLASLFKPVL